MLAALLFASAGACAADDDPSPAASTTGPLTVGVVYDVGGVGHGGVNDGAALAVARAEDRLGAQVRELEPDATGSDREALIRTLADDEVDLVVTIGRGSGAAVEDVADDHPDQRFIVVDDGVLDLPNVTSLELAEEEGAYLVGAAAALSSTAKHVGFLGGIADDATRRYEAGFRAGARKAVEDVAFDAAYVPPGPDGGPGDDAAARGSAEALYATGADIVFAAPRRTGGPLFAVAAQQGRRAVGADGDEAQTADPAVRGSILTSMLKHLDLALLVAIEAFDDGRLDPGRRRVGVAEGAVGFAPGALAPEVVARVEELSQQIADGRIRIPTVP